MPRTIQQVRVPRNVVRELPTPITNRIEVPVAVTNNVAPPVVSGIAVPIVDIPDTTIEYPTLDAPTEQEFQGDLRTPPTQNTNPNTSPDTRDLPDSSPPPVPDVQTPVIDVGGLEIPLPDPAPLVAAGSLAVVTTVVTLGATIGVQQAKNALEPMIKKALQPKKKKKIKIKQVKPVLHYIPNDNGTVECIQYSAKGMKILEGGIEKFEQHLRDQVEIDSLWEYDNKIIIDEELSKQLTKEGLKRFKKYFAAPKVIAKKLGAKFSI